MFLELICKTTTDQCDTSLSIETVGLIYYSTWHHIVVIYANCYRHRRHTWNFLLDIDLKNGPGASKNMDFHRKLAALSIRFITNASIVESSIIVSIHKSVSMTTPTIYKTSTIYPTMLLLWKVPKGFEVKLSFFVMYVGLSKSNVTLSVTYMYLVCAEFLWKLYQIFTHSTLIRIMNIKNSSVWTLHAFN